MNPWNNVTGSLSFSSAPEIKNTQMKIPLFHVDAFTSEIFTGNPAAVCLLDTWLSDDLLLNIAAENNLSETAFVVQADGQWQIRWFTPKVEIDLCGHATLASAFILFANQMVNGNQITFASKSGRLHVEQRADGLLAMILPARKALPCVTPEIIQQALGIKPLASLSARDLLIIVNSQEEVQGIQPNFALLKEITDHFAVIISAPGNQVDFVSRFFAPNAGIPEDPVTGSSHCTLIPYWAERLQKNTLHALQLSPRGGELFCENRPDQVVISGQATLYLQGEISL